ncbi:hypothetical protein M0R04_08685 [Candidatus Dojkabacteria bacterium]|jgi:hypothetical protein|nr:hypothetical protein [Candidatus Dojkabacteria bacterium]
METTEQFLIRIKSLRKKLMDDTITEDEREEYYIMMDELYDKSHDGDYPENEI